MQEILSVTSAHTQPKSLEMYSFWWTEARLVLGAISLFAGLPILYRLIPGATWVTGILTLVWIISGAVAAYMLYRWNKNGRSLFGKKDKMDMYAFLVSAVTGINLGLTGLTKNNPGLSIFTGRVFWIAAGLVYLATAYHLYKRWNESGKRIF